MRILELENRCTGNRTVGSNPTLSAKSVAKAESYLEGRDRNGPAFSVEACELQTFCKRDFPRSFVDMLLS